MVFVSLIMTENGVITAKAIGHPTDVAGAFREACQMLLFTRGPWRITEMTGKCSDDETLDSEMIWTMEARTKTTAV